jgi:hypothetical protein
MSPPSLLHPCALSALGFTLLSAPVWASTWVGHPTVKAPVQAQVTQATLSVSEVVFETCAGAVLTLRPSEPIELVAGALLPAPDGAVCAVTVWAEAPLTLRLAAPGGRQRELQLDVESLRVELPEGIEADDQGQVWIGLSELQIIADHTAWDQLAAAIVLG